MKICIVGSGNVFMSDGGFGPYVIKVLEAFYDLPRGVELIDAGMPGLDVTAHLDGADAVIRVDVQTEGAPGDIQVHRCLDSVTIAVSPEWVATGVALSRPVRSAIAPVVGLVVTELERLGCHVALRAVPRAPDTWWERVEQETPVAV